jgi:hypothetical protein
VSLSERWNHQRGPIYSRRRRTAEGKESARREELGSGRSKRAGCRSTLHTDQGGGRNVFTRRRALSRDTTGALSRVYSEPFDLIPNSIPAMCIREIVINLVSI